MITNVIGLFSVNFKKNEKNYNAAQSEVFKMLQEAEKEPKSPEPGNNLLSFQYALYIFDINCIQIISIELSEQWKILLCTLLEIKNG